MGGRFFGVSRVADDGSFDFDEHHYMLSCRCRVIDTRIVQWCDAHDAYYARVLAPEKYRPPGWEQACARWNGVVETKDPYVAAPVSQ